VLKGLTEYLSRGYTKMTAEDNGLSLSLFTLEADRKPLVVYAAMKHRDAEDFFSDERLRTKLQLTTSGGVAIVDDRSILRVRMANATERARYREKATQPSVTALVFLVEIDSGE
jgi:hypothetical protein